MSIQDSEKSSNLISQVLLSFLLELPPEMQSPKSLPIKKPPTSIVLVLFVGYAGKQTPKGPNYNVHDKFLYSKGPEYKIGTQPRNTLDTKAKY